MSMSERPVGQLVAAGFGALALVTLAGVAPFVATGAVRRFGVPFNPTETDRVRALLRRLPMASVANPRKLVDLGAGDGRIVVAAAARRNFHAVGYEFNPWLVLYARLASLAAGVGSLRLHHPSRRAGRADFVCGDMFSAHRCAATTTAPVGNHSRPEQQQQAIRSLQ